MLIRVKPYYKTGAYIIEPVNKKYLDKESDHYLGTVFCQSEEQLPDFIREHPSYKDLDQGWDITIRIDEWTFLQISNDVKSVD